VYLPERCGIVIATRPNQRRQKPKSTMPRTPLTTPSRRWTRSLPSLSRKTRAVRTPDGDGAPPATVWRTPPSRTSTTGVCFGGRERASEAAEGRVARLRLATTASLQATGEPRRCGGWCCRRGAYAAVVEVRDTMFAWEEAVGLPALPSEPGHLAGTIAFLRRHTGAE
jgi:hypothetical protein